MCNPIIQTIRDDFNFVRSDIADLKKCQLQYFTLSITGTAAILSISNYFISLEQINYFVPLTPLLIALPCWWIFFDKAHTISRNIGYVQVLEEILIDNKKAGNYYFGFENALRKLRNNGEDKTIKIIKPTLEKKCIFELFKFNKHRFRYWTLNWIVFTFLSYLCCTFSWIILYRHHSSCLFSSENTFQLFILFISSFFVLVTSIYTLFIVKKLVFGEYSYNSYYKIWKLILKSMDNSHLEDNIQNEIKKETFISLMPIIKNSEENN